MAASDAAPGLVNLSGLMDQGNRVKPIPSYPEYAEACCIAEARRSLRNRLKRSGNWVLLPKAE